MYLPTVASNIKINFASSRETSCLCGKMSWPPLKQPIKPFCHVASFFNSFDAFSAVLVLIEVVVVDDNVVAFQTYMKKRNVEKKGEKESNTQTDRQTNKHIMIERTKVGRYMDKVQGSTNSIDVRLNMKSINKQIRREQRYEDTVQGSKKSIDVQINRKSPTQRSLVTY